MLSDPTRRREYDSLHSSRSSSERSQDPSSSSNFFSQFSGLFGGGAGPGAPNGQTQQPDAEGVFTDVFEEVRMSVIASFSLINIHLAFTS